MNRRLVVGVGVLCAVGMTAGAASTALAGTSSTQATSASHSTSANHSTSASHSISASHSTSAQAKSSSSVQVTSKPTITVGKATTLATLRQDSAGTQSSAQGTVTINTTSSTQPSGTSARAQLQSAIQSLHAAIKDDQSARKQLQQAVQNFRAALQQAERSGDASAVKTVITQTQGLRTILSQAMNDRQEVGTSEKVSLKDQNSNHIAKAVSAISAVVTRDEREAQAMQKAAQELNNLTATLKSATTSPAKPGSANAELTLWSKFGHLPDSQVHIGGLKGSLSLHITAGPHHS